MKPEPLAQEGPPSPAATAPPTQQAFSETPALRTVVDPPRFDLTYLDNPAPRYPALSKRLGETGTVMLRVRVDETGKVQHLEVETSSGHPRLDRAALDAVRIWHFAPARRAGEAVTAWARVPLTFKLD